MYVIVYLLLTTMINFSTSSITISKQELDELASNCKEDFCDSIENYPETLINQLLKENDALVKQRFQNKPIVTNRDNIESNFENMCNVQAGSFSPKAGKNSENITKIIINTADYTQHIDMISCGKFGDCECSKTRIPGYTVKCNQEMISIHLVVLDEVSIFRLDKFNISGGCSCVYKPEFFLEEIN